MCIFLTKNIQAHRNNKKHVAKCFYETIINVLGTVVKDILSKERGKKIALSRCVKLVVSYTNRLSTILQAKVALSVS